MEQPAVCPTCEASAVLIPLGERRERCVPWRPWRTAITPLYLCDGCGAVVAGETPARRATGHGARRRGGRVQRLAASARLTLRTAIVHQIVVVLVVLLALSLCGVVGTIL
jgi:hypothetical protein